MNKKKIKKVLVILGGTSGERGVSLDSGKACINALKRQLDIYLLVSLVVNYLFKYTN